MSVRIRLLVWGSEWPYGLPPEVHVEMAPPETPPRLVAQRAQGLGADAIVVLPPLATTDPGTLQYLRTQTDRSIWLVSQGGVPDFLEGSLAPCRILPRLDLPQVERALAPGQAPTASPSPVITLFAPASPPGSVTSLALAMARRLEQTGRDTVMCDFDLYTPRLAIDLNLWPENPPYPGLERFLRDPGHGPLRVPNSRHLTLVPGLYDLENLDDMDPGDMAALLGRLAPALRLVVTSSVLVDAGTYAALTEATALVLVVDDSVVSRFHMRRYRNVLLALGLPFRHALLVLDHSGGESAPMDAVAVEEEIGLMPVVTLPARPIRSPWTRGPGRSDTAFQKAVSALVDSCLNGPDSPKRARTTDRAGGAS